jgi:hypothetical protein
LISQVAHFAEVHDADHLARHNHKVAGVGIGVEKAIFQDFLDDHASRVHGYLAALVAGIFHRRHVVDLDTLDAFEHEYARGGVFPIYVRNVEERLSGEVGPEAIRVPPFQAIVQLVVQRVDKVVSHGHEVKHLPVRRPLGGWRERLQDFEVSRNGWLDVRPLHFDNHLAAIGQCGSMHLAQRSCSEWFGGDRCEDFLGRVSELLGDHVSDGLPGHGRHRILQLAQFGHVGRGQQIRASGENLAELHKSRSQFFQRLPEMHRRILLSHWRSRLPA